MTRVLVVSCLLVAFTACSSSITSEDEFAVWVQNHPKELSASMTDSLNQAHISLRYIPKPVYESNPELELAEFVLTLGKMTTKEAGHRTMPLTITNLTLESGDYVSSNYWIHRETGINSFDQKILIHFQMPTYAYHTVTHDFKVSGQILSTDTTTFELCIKRKTINQIPLITNNQNA